MATKKSVKNQTIKRAAIKKAVKKKAVKKAVVKKAVKKNAAKKAVAKKVIKKKALTKNVLNGKKDISKKVVKAAIVSSAPTIDTSKVVSATLIEKPKIEENHIQKAESDVIEHKVSAAKISDFNTRNIYSPYDDEKYVKYINELDALRNDGENKVTAIKGEIRDIKLNKQIDKQSKQQLIDSNINSLKEANVIAKQNASKVHSIISIANKESKKDFKNYYSLVKKKEKEEIVAAKKLYREMVKRFKEEHKNKIHEIKQTEFANSEEYKLSLKTENIAYSAKLSEAKTARNDSIDSAKQFKYNSFMNKYDYSSKIRNDKHSFGEWLQFKKEHYVANFNFGNWLIKNALYIIIIAIFFVLVGISGGGLLSNPNNILEALVQIAPKIFFALGVGGLILLGGTDLSIGRLTGIGVSFSLMLLASQPYADNYGVVWFNILGAHPALKVICAILLSITFCTFFTAFAGFFTAKFKMHPFISTLAVQLISFGFFQLFWSGVASFTADADPGTVVDLLRGPNSILLVVYAAVAILIIWFIWNKTRFGKNIYAVGGNQEAAVVSGINPFVITLSAFIMAGILYGLGGFVQALQVPTGNFNSGYGTETDAIAACVIGGVSFSGGVGKVSGVVIGTIILGFLTYAFNFLGINANLQLLIKGVIILIAVALDCVKYLRKK